MSPIWGTGGGTETGRTQGHLARGAHKGRTVPAELGQSDLTVSRGKGGGRHGRRWECGFGWVGGSMDGF